MLGVFTDCISAGIANGVPTIVPVQISLDGFLTQWQTVVPSGAGIDTVITVDTTVAPPDTTTTYVPVNLRAYATKTDTAMTGGGSGRPQLLGTGVPFFFLDRTGQCDGCGVQNHHTYFYTVSAFDINSIRSGPSSMESSLVGARSVVPGPPPVNSTSAGAVQPVRILGQGGPLTDSVLPTLDPVTGRFNKRFPPANGVGVSLQAFLPQVLPDSGGVTIRLDDIDLGSSHSIPGQPIIYRWSVFSGNDSLGLTTSLVQDATNFTQATSAVYQAVALDSAAAAKYGGGNGYRFLGQLNQTLVGTYYTNAWGRGCVNGADGFVYTSPGGCDYNGSRWFLGPSPATNETRAHPIAGNGDNFNPGAVNNAAVVGGVPNGGFNNAGELRNVEVIHQPYSYQTMGNQWRDVEGVISGAKRAADYNVYWSATTPGLIDRVHDVTHDVDVPFLANRLGGSYGLLTHALAQPSGAGQSFDARAELTLADFGCIEPLRSAPSSAGGGPGRVIGCGGTIEGGDGPIYSLTQQAELGAIAHFTGSTANSQTSANTGQGFAMYIAGNLIMFQTTTLPTATVWSLRDYVGAITGGNGFGGNDGPYAFYPVVRPFSAVGASLHLGFTASNTIAMARDRDLRRVHTVPDPYYERSALEGSIAERVIKFVNLPERAIIRIYTVSGILVTAFEHNNPTSSEASWDLRNRNGRLVASGVYFWHVEALNARRVGRMTLITAHRR